MIPSWLRKKRYDLPLHKKEGTGFILWVIALMTFLCAMTLAGSFFLSNLTKTWEEGLKGQMTIEVKAQINQQGDDIRMDTALQKEIETSVLALIKNDYPRLIARPIPEADILTMIAPWFGMMEDDENLSETFPIPTLIALEIPPQTPPIDTASFEEKLRDISPDIHLDTHEQWLGDMVQLTHKIRNIGYLLALVIGITTMVAVAGASRSRLSMHFTDIELLHLIGANDDYIAKQFSRHATLMTFEGCMVGAIMALSSLWLVTHFQTPDEAALIPALNLSIFDWAALASLPALGCGIAFITSRFTTLSFLKRLP